MKQFIQLLAVIFVITVSANAQIGGYALQFNGTSSYVNCGTGSSFNITNNLTIEAWINTDDINQNWQTIAGKQSNPYEYYTLIIESDTKKPALWFSLDNPTSTWHRQVIANTALTQNRWYHIVGTYDGTTAKIYIDGKLDNSAACSGTIVSSVSVPFQIGKNNNVHFNGKIDEVRVWNVARTEAQIKANMYKELAGNKTGLVAYYKMSDGSGTSQFSELSEIKI